MKFQSQTYRQVLAALIFMLAAAASASSQTSDELRAKYGQPELIKLNSGRAVAERYRVRPGVLLTVTYTGRGQICEMYIEPVPTSASKDDDGPGDLMPTEIVIEIINELVPAALRGNRIGSGSVNGGDPAMKLNHPGCWGNYYVMYEHVTISCSTWCQGGTFSATIHWGETNCPGQKLTIKKKR